MNCLPDKFDRRIQFMPRLPKALIFDVFGTVVDWRSGIAATFSRVAKEKGIGMDAHKFADLWRAEYQPAMQRVRSGNRGYVPLETLHLENLDLVLEATGLSGNFSPQERELLNRGWEQLPPWPDVQPGLARLKEHATIAPCSNGSAAMMREQAAFSDLPWDRILGADIARNYKPEKSVYLKSCEALSLVPSEVMMVAAHNDDLVAARQAGLQCAFIARPTEHGKGQKIDLKPTDKWEFCANSFTDLADVFET